MSIWIQITSGQGPAECCLAVAKVAAAMQQEAARAPGALPLLLLDHVSGPKPETFHSITYCLESAAEPAWLQSWTGTIKWIAESPFRPNHKRKNWFVGVEVLKQPDANKFDLTKVKLEFIRSSGPGGQNVNKVASAVRITHLPSGIAVVAQDQRSQHQNRSLAFERLKQRLQVEEDRKQSDAKQKLWDNHWNLERGNPVRVYSGAKFHRDR